jgi:hypothetical protein
VDNVLILSKDSQVLPNDSKPETSRVLLNNVLNPIFDTLQQNNSTSTIASLKEAFEQAENVKQIK